MLLLLYKFKKGDKDIDEFGQEECSICMEEFVAGQKVRKIPTCRHIFHDHCLIKWFSGEQSFKGQKCPDCNMEISPEVVEVANEYEKQKGSSFNSRSLQKMLEPRRPSVISQS